MKLLLGGRARMGRAHTLEAEVSVCLESRPSEKEQRGERGLKDGVVFF